MKEKKKNEEFHSRREFFKKAVKGILPFLGAVMIVPSILSSCSTCVGGCGASCATACRGKSSYYPSGCSGTCKSACLSTCKGLCMATARKGL